MKLDSIFTSHMVFAAKQPIRIYGEGRGEAQICFAQAQRTVISAEDNWLVELPAMDYGGPYTLTAVFEDNTVVLEDIYIGEVYLFAGQSNMQFKLQGSSTPENLYDGNNMLRIFSTEKLEKTDYFHPEDGWVLCEKENIGKLSAIGYLAGKAVSEAKNIAVGGIICAQGASVIESWVPKGAFENIGINIPSDKKHSDHFNELFKTWNGDGTLYSYALSQVIPFAVSAVIWYQGESDSTMAEAEVYAEELATLIKVWRKDLCNESLPFIVIQIADFDTRSDDAWKGLQQAQDKVQYMLPHVKTVMSRDVCETDDIHPKTKYRLAHRVAEELIKL